MNQAPKTYQIPADLMQGALNALGTMPWAQINSVLAPLVQTVQQQQEAATVEAPKAD